MTARPFSRMTMTSSPLRRERGVIMVIALITLVILMIGAIATIRSMNSSLTSVGNFGFKRDMANQADRAMVRAMKALSTPGAGGGNNDASINYSAALLQSTPEGIPNVLLSTSNPDQIGGYGSTANVVDLTVAQTGESTSDIPRLKVYYVIDRMCLTTGDMDPTKCHTAAPPVVSVDDPNKPAPSPKPLYRVTVRVDGPRDSQSFYQATFSN